MFERAQAAFFGRFAHAEEMGFYTQPQKAETKDAATL
jgi:hypothetical protein